MKTSKLLMATTLSTAVGLSTLYSAAVAADVRSDSKVAGVVMGSTLTGAVAGGPLGAFAGFLAGAWLGEQVQTADTVELTQAQLATATEQLDTLSAQLSHEQMLSKQYAQTALDQLQLELLFKTGDGQLTASGQQRMQYLADFMVGNPELNIRLDGYADPRGDANYNLALSEQRVQSVAALLASHGVAMSRIEIYAHGDAQSVAAVGDYDGYAMERIVKIQLSKGDKQEAFAQVTISE